MRVDQTEQRPLDGVAGVAMTMLSEGTTAERVRVDVAVLEAGASLPRHRAGREQVFHVLAGTGRVAGPDDVPVDIGPGQAAVWARGEEHTSWADTRMTVLIIQRAGAES
jgi:quercetin dioxygenase-like cupin family protein